MNNTYVYRRTNFFSFSSSQGSNDTNQESIPLVIFRQITISSEIVRPSLLLVILLINLWHQCGNIDEKSPIPRRRNENLKRRFYHIEFTLHHGMEYKISPSRIISSLTIQWFVESWELSSLLNFHEINVESR